MSKVLIIYGYYDESDHYGCILSAVKQRFLRQGVTDIETINTYTFTRTHLNQGESTSGKNTATWFRGLRTTANDALIHAQQNKLLSADKIIFIYPIWWESLPPLMLTWISEVFRSVSFRVGEDGRPIGQWGGHREVLILTTAGFANHIRQEQFANVLPSELGEQIIDTSSRLALSELCQTYPLKTALSYAGMNKRIIEHHFDNVTTGDDPALLEKIDHAIDAFLEKSCEASHQHYFPSGGPRSRRQAAIKAEAINTQILKPKRQKIS